MHFTKMHGLGNDYIYVYGPVPENVAELSVKLSERHTGIGSDGMIFISPSGRADFMMRIFNTDGSEAKMCGNGIRCVGKYVYDKGYTDSKLLKIDTLSGIKTLTLKTMFGKVMSVSVDMGKAVVSEDMELDVCGRKLSCTPVDVGNPHAVFFVEDMDQADVAKLGPAVEHSSAFPGGVNAEFVQVLEDGSLRMRVWERGSGITMACGTGACASAAAAVSKRFCRPDTPIEVKLDGGPLSISVSSGYEITMEGPAETAFEGEAEI